MSKIKIKFEYKCTNDDLKSISFKRNYDIESLNDDEFILVTESEFETIKRFLYVDLYGERYRIYDFIFNKTSNNYYWILYIKHTNDAFDLEELPF